MSIRLIADVHSALNGLTGLAQPGDSLIILGDVLGLIDWADFSGILTEALGKEYLAQAIQEAAKLGPGGLKDLKDRLLSEGGERYPELKEAVERDYEDFRRAVEEAGYRAYVLYGNSDIPWALRDVLEESPNAVLAEGVYELEGERFGMVPGAITSPWDMPCEVEDEEFGRRLGALGEVDVLCTHVPPLVSEATFDVLANRPQTGSRALLEYIEETQPRFAYHGHVHQPAQREIRIGRTRVINVAYYKRTGYVHTHET